MFLFIHGSDTFRSKQFLEQSLEDFKKKRDPQGFNTVVLDGLSEKPERMIAEILTAPFLAEKRMVVLKNLLSSKDQKFLSNILERLKDDKLPETNVVIFWQAEKVGQSGDAKKLFDFLKKGKFNYEFSPLSSSELIHWIVKEADGQNGKIGTAAANYLSQNTFGDMWLTSSLLNQLLSYVDKREILTEDIKKFLPEKVEDNIFMAAEMIAQGNKKQAFRLVNEQRRLGQDESYLFSMVLRQFKILLQMRDVWDNNDNISSDVMAKILNLHPFVVKKSLPLMKRFSFSILKRTYDDLLDMDIGVKTGTMDQSVALDGFIGKV